MPNHVTNRVVLIGSCDDVVSAKNLLVEQSVVLSQDNTTTYSSHPEIDFNKLIPKPKILDRVMSPPRYGENGRLMMKETDDPFSYTQREATVEEQDKLNKLSHKDWYSWAIDNWGTKWNGYNFQEIGDHARYDFSFDTAWSAPNPIFDELHKRFPFLTVELSWFDEGWMHAGQGVLGAGSSHSSESFYTEANAEIYERVFGVPPEIDDEEPIISDNQNRLLDNFTCEDVRTMSDKHGYYAISSVAYSDDPEMSDDELYALRKTRDHILCIS